MTSVSSSRRWYTIGALLVGTLVIVAGALLSLRHQLLGLDANERAAAQLAAPTLRVASIGPKAVAVRLTMITEESGRTKFLFEPSDDAKDAGRLLVSMSSVEDFSWTATTDVTQVSLREGAAGQWTSEDVVGSSGTASSVAFTIAVGAGASLASIEVTTPGSFVTQGGAVVLAHVPHVQVLYNDTIEDLSIIARVQDDLETGNAEEASRELSRALTVGSLDGEPMYMPALSIRASAPQLDLVHPNWRARTIYPAPTASNPLNWEESLKFLPYLEYEDLGFRKQTEREQLWGGLLIGLGGGILLMPLAEFLEGTQRAKRTR